MHCPPIQNPVRIREQNTMIISTIIDVGSTSGVVWPPCGQTTPEVKCSLVDKKNQRSRSNASQKAAARISVCRFLLGQVSDTLRRSRRCNSDRDRSGSAGARQADIPESLPRSSDRSRESNDGRRSGFPESLCRFRNNRGIRRAAP